MVREFSEEKRQEIFRLLDEIDMRDWKSFMEWCGSRKEEFGDWPDKLSVSAYTRYVDEYHEKVLETNEMTRQQVNTVFENVAEIDARYAARFREHREKVKEQIAIVKKMTEFMDSMSNDIPNKAHRSGGGSNENCGWTENTVPDNTNSSYIEDLYKNGWISEEEYQYLQYLLTTSDHVPGSERMVIMEILEEKISYYRNTRDINSLGYQWIQGNLAALDSYLEENGLKWPEVIKQHVLSEYYNMYIGNNTSALPMAGVELVLDGLDGEKCQELYDIISTDYIYIIWYGKPMQIEGGDSDGEQYLARRIEESDNLRNSWSQEKTDQLWASCEQIYDEYGIAIDPRFLLAIIILEGTGSFNTSSANPAADGGNGPHPEYDQDLENAIDLILGKTLGYIIYNEQFREAANNNSNLLENSPGNIFTYYNWETPIIALDGSVRTGVYAGDYKWGTKVEDIYESLTYEGAGEDYNQYILSIKESAVQDIIQRDVTSEFTFLADGDGVNYLNEHCGAYTIIAEESD